MSVLAKVRAVGEAEILCKQAHGIEGKGGRETATMTHLHPKKCSHSLPPNVQVSILFSLVHLLVVLTAHCCLLHRILEEGVAQSLTAFVWNLYHNALESVELALRGSPCHRESIALRLCPPHPQPALSVWASQETVHNALEFRSSPPTPPRLNLGWWVMPVLPSFQAHVLHHPAFQLLSEWASGKAEVSCQPALNRDWALIKVQSWHWHLHLNMKCWALGTGYLILQTYQPWVTQPERLWTCLCVFRWELCCADTSNRAMLRGEVILGWKP